MLLPGGSRVSWQARPERSRDQQLSRARRVADLGTAAAGNVTLTQVDFAYLATWCGPRAGEHQLTRVCGDGRGWGRERQTAVGAGSVRCSMTNAARLISCWSARCRSRYSATSAATTHAVSAATTVRNSKWAERCHAR